MYRPSRDPLHALGTDRRWSPEAALGDGLRHGDDRRLPGLCALRHPALQPALPQRDLPGAEEQRQTAACLRRSADRHHRLSPGVVLRGLPRSHGEERGGVDAEATAGDAWNCWDAVEQGNSSWNCPCVLQVSPLFGTIYNSILFMAHAVHRVRQSEEWMSGGNLARHTRNLAFQVLRGSWIRHTVFKGVMCKMCHSKAFKYWRFGFPSLSNTDALVWQVRPGTNPTQKRLPV